MTTALIDGDLICYISAVSADEADERFATYRAEKMLGRILEEVGCDSYRVFLSGGNNFRKQINPEYKAQRPPPPEHLKACRQLMVDRHNAEVTNGYEADDALGIAQTKDTVIATIDKDLLMVEGRHYNYVKKEWAEVSAKEGEYFFYKQMITGDKVDNIIGIRGLGEKKASKLLDTTPRKLWDKTITDLYIKEFEDGYHRAVQNTQLLWMLQRDKQMPMEFK